MQGLSPQGSEAFTRRRVVLLPNSEALSPLRKRLGGSLPEYPPLAGVRDPWVSEHAERKREPSRTGRATSHFPFSHGERRVFRPRNTKAGNGEWCINK